MRNLRRRVAGILAHPKAEWAAIADEPDDVAAVYRDYIAILAAIPAVCMFLGLTLAGAPLLGRYGVPRALASALTVYASALVAPIVAAVVLKQLAPKFQSSGSLARALKLVAYASTPVWVAGVFYLFLALARVAAVAVLYAVYLFYVGLPVLMRTPPDKIVPFMVVAALYILVLNIVLRWLVVAYGLPMYAV